MLTSNWAGKYQLEPKQNFHGVPPITEERVKETLRRAVERTKTANEIGGKKAKRARKGDDLRKALADGFPEFPYHLLEHVFTESKIDTDQKAGDVLESEVALQSTITALRKAEDTFKSLEVAPPKGYIIATARNPTR